MHCTACSSWILLVGISSMIYITSLSYHTVYNTCCRLSLIMGSGTGSGTCTGADLGVDVGLFLYLCLCLCLCLCDSDSAGGGDGGIKDI